MISLFSSPFCHLARFLDSSVPPFLLFNPVVFLPLAFLAAKRPNGALR